MYKKFTEKQKESIVELHTAGQSAAALCADYELPRSTLYSWINQYQQLKSSNQSGISYKEYHNLKRRAEKLDEQLKVVKAAGCSPSAALQDKLTALEKLYGQYSVHVLCEALDVSRGTFYNHIFRKKDVTVWHNFGHEGFKTLEQSFYLQCYC